MQKGLINIDPKDFGVSENRAKEVSQMFIPMLKKMEEMEAEANRFFKSLDGDNITNEDVFNARELRLQYVKIRTGTAKICKRSRQNN